MVAGTRWIELGNYLRLVIDPDFWQVIGNTVWDLDRIGKSPFRSKMSQPMLTLAHERFKQVLKNQAE